MIDASILLYSSYGGVLMRSKRIPAEEQYRLIMECRRPQWGQVLERGYKKKKSRAKI